MFQLKKSLEDWKKNLNTSNALTESDIEELESHLLDEIDSLKLKNLTDEESFYVACSRIGSTDLLTNEFSKININYIWLKKILWLLSGYLLIGFCQQLTSISSTFITGLVVKFTDLSTNGMMYLNLVLNFILSAIVLCALFLPKLMIISNVYSKFNYLFNYKRWLLISTFIIFFIMTSIGFLSLKIVLTRIVPVWQLGYIQSGEMIFTLIWPAALCLMVLFLSLKNHNKNKTIG